MCSFGYCTITVTQIKVLPLLTMALGLTFFATSPNGTNALTMSRGLDALWRADIVGGASMVSVDLGDFGEDADQPFLSVYDNTDNLLGTTSLDIGQDISGMFTLSLLGNNISYATFGKPMF